MKLVVLGGSSIATPELISALAQLAPELPLRVALVGRDANKLALVGRVCAALAGAEPNLELEWTTELGRALEDAQFVLNQVRVGGLEARAFDESFPHQFNIPGEETVGPGGFASALRTVPVCVALAQEVERRAPAAWFINLTNPASIVHAALERTSNVRIVSICNSPVTLSEQVAVLVDQPLSEVKIDYLGMLHFGWIVRVMHGEIELLPRALENISRLPGLSADPRLVQAIGAIPSPYLNYFLAPDVMLARQRAKGHTRAPELLQMEAQIIQAYEAGNYAIVNQRAAVWYEKIIVPVLRALVQGGQEIVNAPNGTALPWLPPDTIIETRCKISADRIEPEPAAPTPPDVRAMLQLNAAYEALTVEAILNDAYDTAWRALRLNPLVSSAAQARALLDLVWESARVSARDGGMNSPRRISLLPGLTLTLDDARLEFGDAIFVQESKTRTRGELAPVAREPQACVPADVIQYRMYNGVGARATRAQWSKDAAQYELTLMAALPLGDELPKTLGHLHNAPFTGMSSFPEIFEVLYGTAHFLCYAFDPVKTRATFCGWIEAAAGDQVVMPPDLYHLTINASGEPLLFADLISRQARGEYDDVRASHGAPYYETTRHEWVRNPAFRASAPLVALQQLRVQASASLYSQLVDAPDSFEWLNDPTQFYQRFPPLKALAL